MKNKIITIFTIIYVSVFLGMPVFVYASSSIVLEPVSVSVVKNKSFSVNIYINPNGGKNYTAKVKVDYPADTIQESSFNIASGWMPISVSGYDLLDNKNGILIKSAGYPNPGISSKTLFGTITFTGIASSSDAKIQIDGTSLVLDGNSKNVIDNNFSIVNVVISEPVAQEKNIQVATTTKPIISKTILAPASNTDLNVATSSVAEVSTETIVASSQEQNTSLGASVVDSGVSNDFSKKVGIVSFAAILIGAIYIFAWRPFGKKDN